MVPRSFEFHDSAVVEAVRDYLDYKNIDYPEWFDDFTLQNRLVSYDTQDPILEYASDGYLGDVAAWVDKVNSNKITECWEERLPNQREIEYNSPSDIIDDLGKKEFDFTKREKAIFRLGFYLGLLDAGSVFYFAAFEHENNG